MGQNCTSCFRTRKPIERSFPWDELQSAGRHWYDVQTAHTNSFEDISQPAVVLTTFQSVEDDKQATVSNDKNDSKNLDSGVASIASMKTKSDSRLTPVKDIITEQSSPQSQQIAALPNRHKDPDLYVIGQGILR